MQNTYSLGFTEKLAELNKSAKSLYEMTPKELSKALEADSRIERDRKSKIKERIVDPIPHTFKDELKHIGHRAYVNSASLARGLAASAGVLAARTGEGVFDMASFMPATADKLLFGSLAGVNDGQGFLGRKLGKLHRKVDRFVDKLRTTSSDYDYQNNVLDKIRKLNTLTNGSAADATGSFLGFGGNAAFIRGPVLHRLLGGGFGLMSAYNTLSEGKEKQLREREHSIRGISRKFRQYIDPTSTAHNQEMAPTLNEYKRYHLPYNGLPASGSGEIAIPYDWRHSGNAPVQFRPYGT